MSEKPSKTYQYGNTKVKIVSPFIELTKEQQREWFESEWKKGNPIIHDIVDAAMDCLEPEGISHKDEFEKLVDLKLK
ncbi:hypothetical protein [Priestia flexa]|uniref:hypothetical protein n=1 Tax=Priestia flexa TaxID=86664 RepID=UPI000473F20A|nr:hypothetical protein [Priestia flexa]